MSDTAAQPVQRMPTTRLLLLLAVPLLLHVCVPAPDEPIFNGDANRHVMTSVFFRDFLNDLPLASPKQYAEEYYRQYPALGLMIWPPLFHGITGTLMLIFGTAVWVARGVVFSSFAVAAVCLYRICRRRVSADEAAIATLIFATLPLVFQYSRYVMLEMTTLALCMICFDRFDMWLRADPDRFSQKDRSSRNLYAAAVAAALAALTRFDAVLLLPALLLAAALQKQIPRLWNRHVAFAAVIALIIAGPVYAVIWQEAGDLHMRQAVESVGGESSRFFSEGCWWYYPAAIPDQTGKLLPPFLIAGLCLALVRYRRESAFFAAMLLAVWLTFTPLAELRVRHTIYWLPAVAWFAMIGARALIQLSVRERSSFRPAVTALVWAALLTGTTWSALQQPVYVLSGYQKAAGTVLHRTVPHDVVLVDAWWDGNFTYHLRHLDPSRTRHVVRGDALLYDFVNVPSVDFQSHVETDEDILRAVQNSKAACIVFEDPQPVEHIEISEQFHRLVLSQPDLFPPVETIPVKVRFPQAHDFQLRVFDINRDQLRLTLQRMDDAISTKFNRKVNSE